MAHADPFQTTTPAGTDDPRDGDDRIRELKRALKERLTLGGIYMDDSGTPDDEAGRLAAGIQAPNVLSVYETDRSTVMAQFNDSTQDLTLGDGKNGANQYQLIAHDIDIYDANIDNDLTVANDLTVSGNIVKAPIQGGTFNRGYDIARNAAGGTLTAGTTGNVIVTTATITTSTHATPPTRHFFAMYTGRWKSTTGTQGSVSLYFERNLAGGGWLSAGFDLGSAAAMLVTEASIGDEGLDNLAFFDVFSIASSNQTLQIRVVADVSAATNVLHANNRVILWEMLQA
jgi:hypothetical protein